MRWDVIRIMEGIVIREESDILRRKHYTSK
jgi:hypothetical protein